VLDSTGQLGGLFPLGAEDTIEAVVLQSNAGWNQTLLGIRREALGEKLVPAERLQMRIDVGRVNTSLSTNSRNSCSVPADEKPQHIVINCSERLGG
jgi:hypothetical protein